MRMLIGLFLCISSTGFSQGHVEVIKDSRIDALVRNESAIVAPATAPQIMGYRLQLFFDTNKSAVDDARSRFIALFPKVDTYVEFTAPHYFLKVGDFRTHLEAEKVKATCEKGFPTSFVVKEKVNLPRID
ncbi:MAG: hypothetical protein QE487_18485 [Fluviicola sp.]|nr:hypothetical protein [Fluviicola sp.]